LYTWVSVTVAPVSGLEMADKPAVAPAAKVPMNFLRELIRLFFMVNLVLVKFKGLVKLGGSRNYFSYPFDLELLLPNLFNLLLIVCHRSSKNLQI